MKVRTRATAEPDAGLQAIDALERDMVAAFDQDAQAHGITPDNAARDRVARVQLAAAVTGRMREEYLSRVGQR